jgi:hypothetical protein
MVRDPHELRCGEAGHHDIAGDGARPRLALFQLEAFGGGASIIPQYRRTQRYIRPVKQGRAMHLAGQADATHCRTRVGRQSQHRIDGGAPPIPCILFRE